MNHHCTAAVVPLCVRVVFRLPQLRCPVCPPQFEGYKPALSKLMGGRPFDGLGGVDAEAQITAIYKLHNPSKIADIPRLVRHLPPSLPMPSVGVPPWLVLSPRH